MTKIRIPRVLEGEEFPQGLSYKQHIVTRLDGNKLSPDLLMFGLMFRWGDFMAKAIFSDGRLELNAFVCTHAT